MIVPQSLFCRAYAYSLTERIGVLRVFGFLMGCIVVVGILSICLSPIIVIMLYGTRVPARFSAAIFIPSVTTDCLSKKLLRQITAAELLSPFTYVLNTVSRKYLL